jgi:hypothetical protein
MVADVRRRRHCPFGDAAPRKAPLENPGTIRAMAAIHRSAATLRVMGDDLDPADITRLLGHAPTRAHARGQAWTSRTTGIERIHKFGAWILIADDAEPEDIGAQATALLAKVTPDLAIWREIGARFEIDLFCGLFMEESNEGMGLSPAILQALGERGIELSLDIYDPRDEPWTGPEALASSRSLEKRELDFYLIAAGFCDWCEKGLEAATPQALVNEASAQLAALYAAGLRLPALEALEAHKGEEEEGEPDVPAPPDRDPDLVNHLTSRFARLPVGYYNMFFRPDDLDDGQPCMGGLQDDLMDIHEDVRRGIWLSRQGHKMAALWEWRFFLDTHWGRHATGALHALAGFREDGTGAAPP